ncbi:SDR family NAD(P)-dependent oxidoreductase [Pseudomonas sp. microsymbiont 2]
MSSTRTFWVTGATQGLGLALAEQLLEQGHRVAVSSGESPSLDALLARYGADLLALPAQLQEPAQAELASQRLLATWGMLDGLIINAGACDYLPADLPQSELFERIVSSNLRAMENLVEHATPLLIKGEKPQVVGIFSPYSALQLHEPNQPLSGNNSAVHWLRERRQHMKAQGIDLTIVAPQSLKTPVTPLQAIPEPWTAEQAAQALLMRLDQRDSELVLEVLSPTELWPLP